MKIGVVSDTHSLEIPQQLINDFKKVDLIIHAGDFCCAQDYAVFKGLNDVKAVYGNMDEPKLCKMLAEKEIIEVDKCRIGIFHGEGPAEKVLESVRKKFKNDNVQIVIFGHSHRPFNEYIGDVLYFNPGSPNDITFAPYQSYGVIEIASGKIKASIIKVKAKNG